VECAFLYKRFLYHFQTKSYKVDQTYDTSYFRVCFSLIKAATTGRPPLDLPSDVSEKTSSTSKGRGIRTYVNKKTASTTRVWEPEPKRKARSLTRAISSSNSWPRISIQTGSCFTSSYSSKRKTRYVSVGFYPTQNCQHLVKFEERRLNQSSLRNSMWRKWRNVYREYARSCVITDNIHAQTGLSDWMRPGDTALPNCTSGNIT